MLLDVDRTVVDENQTQLAEKYINQKREHCKHILCLFSTCQVGYHPSLFLPPSPPPSLPSVWDRRSIAHYSIAQVSGSSGSVTEYCSDTHTHTHTYKVQWRHWTFLITLSDLQPVWATHWIDQSAPTEWYMWLLGCCDISQLCSLCSNTVLGFGRASRSVCGCLCGCLCVAVLITQRCH